MLRVESKMNLTSELKKTIEATIEAYVSNPEPHLVNVDPSLNMRQLAAELKILPVVLDMGGCFCLRSDGEIVSFIWDEPHQLRAEGEERIRNLVLFQAAKKFPELEELTPSRPTTALDCDFCKGTGIVIDLPPNLARDILCFCGGLGWLT